MARKTEEKEWTVTRKFVGTQKLEDVLLSLVEYRLDRFANETVKQNWDCEEERDKDERT
ncbi:hypothetical protein [Heyndrickxia sporothermodurans]|uniref:hypothetical protein n=1 Tax=Heyndrickxia sporothermodurans TaxID=46224 RepID=UPI0013FD5538|nr:hypothetical protein [Heyndrickxia sporothermodurans]